MAFQPFAARKGVHVSGAFGSAKNKQSRQFAVHTDDFDPDTWLLKKWGGVLFQTLLIGNGEFMAALFSAARNEFAAVLGRHSAAESVLVLAGAAGRLVGTFHR